MVRMLCAGLLSDSSGFGFSLRGVTRLNCGIEEIAKEV